MNRHRIGWVGALWSTLQGSFVWALAAFASAGEGVELDRLRASATLQQQFVLRDVRDDFTATLNQSADSQAWPDKVSQAGQQLWQQSRALLQTDQRFDDRPLYWTRLAMREQLLAAMQARQLNAHEQQQLLAILEQSSRGQFDIRYEQNRARIFVTGFDPFRLDQRADQSNPSGLAALALDGRVLNIEGRPYQIEAVMVPVRFADFDAGLIETLLTPVLQDPQMRLIATISMGRRDFDLERFPARRRSADFPDNSRHKTGANLQRPLPPLLHGLPLDGPEFVEFSLPADRMRRVQQPFAVHDNRQVTTLAAAMQAPSLDALRFHTSVNGSGGGYLSNEISYRSLRLRDQLAVQLPVGHIHTPPVLGYDEEKERQIVAQIEAMLAAALE